MRISHNKNDPAYCQVTNDVKVFLNKREVRYVVTADEDLGIVITQFRNNGKYKIIHHKRELRTITLKGEVNIYLGPKTKSYLKLLKVVS